jgi:hypothetical protein
MNFSNQSDIAKLQNYIDEALKSKFKIAAEQDQIAALASAVKDDLQVEPKLFKKLVDLAFKSNAEEVFALNEQIEETYNSLNGVK